MSSGLFGRTQFLRSVPELHHHLGSSVLCSSSTGNEHWQRETGELSFLWRQRPELQEGPAGVQY